jgi:hypothetical protein
MATASKRKHRAGREEERHRLHDAVDNILDGPDPNDMDRWVRETLVGIGLLIRAAHPALHYEIGRVISGTDRPHGSFPCNLSWEDAAISVDAQLADEWIAAGKAALGETPPPHKVQQRALAALLRPIASIALHAWLMDLASALDALPLGDVHRIVTRSSTKLHGYKEGPKIWLARKLALEWIEFQRHAKLMSKTGAEREVATAFGIGEASIKKEWKPTVKALFGTAVADEGLKLAETYGRRYRSIQCELASDKLEKATVARELEHYASVYGKERLDALAKVYKRRKRRSGGKASSPSEAVRPTETRAGARSDLRRAR